MFLLSVSTMPAKRYTTAKGNGPDMQHSQCFLQTLLERIKSIFIGVPGLAPERIAPTVGLNS